MPRAARSAESRTLDYFRHADLGSAKVVAALAMDIVADRSQTALDGASGDTPKAVKRRTRRAAPAAQPIQEVTQ
jgi:hypothetical protein